MKNTVDEKLSMQNRPGCTLSSATALLCTPKWSLYHLCLPYYVISWPFKFL